MPPSTSPPRPTREPSFSISSQRLGLYVLLASLSVLFIASLVAYLITRAESGAWRPPGMPGLPAGLWVSSAFAVMISAGFELAVRAVRRNQNRALERNLWMTLLFVLAFLLAQIANWEQMHEGTLAVQQRTLFPYTFYMLTGLHAAHVLGGLVPLAIVLFRTRRKEYSSSRHEGVVLCAKYWHFLSVVWAVLFLVLKLGSR